MHTSIRHSAQTLPARSLWLRRRSQGKTSSTHVSSSWLILLFVVAVSSLWLSCDWNGQVGPRRGTTTGRWDGTASVSVDTKLTNAEHSMRPITRNTVKIYHDTNGKNHGPVWKIQSFHLNGICTVILWQDYYGKGNLKNPIETWLGENSKLGMSLCTS